MSVPPSLVERLKRRKLVQWGAAYLGGAWLALQLVDILGNAFHWSDPVEQGAIALLAVGFVAALVVAWYHGEKGAQRVSGVELLMLAGILVVAGGLLAMVGGGQDRRGAPAPAGARAGGAGATSVAAERGSVAVLPFLDLSPGHDQAYFTDGLAEELLNVLSQLPELRVAARTSAFSFKGHDVRVDSIGRALHVAHVLEGSVRRAGDRVRITVQLIRADSGYHIWSHDYDRQLNDVFAVQDEIARAVVQVLRVKLAAGRAEAPLAKQETGDPEAHALLLRGMSALARITRTDVAQAVEMFREATVRDPRYARAYACLAMAVGYQAEMRWGPREALVRRAKELAARALALDSTLADAHFVLGTLLRSYDWDFASADAEYTRAAELNPGNALARSYRAWLLMELGRTAEALGEARLAAELDPLSAGILSNLGSMYSYAHQPRRAIEAYEDALRMQPGSALLLANLALTYVQARQSAEAIRMVERSRAADPRDQSTLAAVAYVHGRAGRRVEAEQALAALERQPEPSPYLLATAYAGLGDRERVLSLLARAVAEHDGSAPDLGVDPVFDAYRADPRMRRLLDRIGLP